MKRDPYKTEENWNLWKEKNFQGINKKNEYDCVFGFFLKYFKLNVDTKKGIHKIIIN